MKGKIFVIEGTDGSGKKTQSELLEKRLNDLGHKCKRLSFPRYDTPTGKIIGGPIQGKDDICESWFENPGSIEPHVTSLYYAADRLYNLKEINEYLDKGYYVILDRYTTSNLAHQGGKIEDKDERFNMYQWIDKLEYWLLGLPKPDLTIFLHVPYEFSLELNRQKEVSDAVEKDEVYMKNAEIAYVELAGLYNWHKINCIKEDKLRTIEDISDDILGLIIEKIKLQKDN